MAKKRAKKQVKKRSKRKPSISESFAALPSKNDALFVGIDLGTCRDGGLG